MKPNLQIIFKKTILVAIILACYTTSYATTMVSNDNIIILGYDDIDINGKNYNVRFVDGTAYDLFFGHTGFDFTFKTRDDAGAAARELLTVINDTSISNTDSPLIFGCDNTSCQINIPYNYLSIYNEVPGISANNEPGIFDSWGDFVGIPVHRDLTNDNWQTFAVFTTVPVPASVWFMGTGIFGLMGLSRKKHKLL